MVKASIRYIGIGDFSSVFNESILGVPAIGTVEF